MTRSIALKYAEEEMHHNSSLICSVVSSETLSRRSLTSADGMDSPWAKRSDHASSVLTTFSGTLFSFSRTASIRSLIALSAFNAFISAVAESFALASSLLGAYFTASVYLAPVKDISFRNTNKPSSDSVYSVSWYNRVGTNSHVHAHTAAAASYQ